LRKREKHISGFGGDIPPLRGHVEIYFDQKGISPNEAAMFYNYYQNIGWHNVRDWKRQAFFWLLKRVKYW